MVSRHVHISSKRQEMQEGSLEMELLLPIEVFWAVENELKQADYLIAAGEDRVAVNDLYRKIYQLVKPYAVREKDRIWLHDKSV